VRLVEVGGPRQREEVAVRARLVDDARDRRTPGEVAVVARDVRVALLGGG
jgi:hypothetical protein